MAINSSCCIAKCSKLLTSLSDITAEKPILVKELTQDECQSEKGEEEMEVDSDEQDEEGKAKTVGAFANTLSTLNALRPGTKYI